MRDCPEEEKAKPENVTIIRDLFTVLQELLGENQRTQDFMNYLGCNKELFIETELKYPKYKEKQIRIAFDKMISDLSPEIVRGYKNKNRVHALYSEEELSRGKYGSILLSGCIFLQYKDKPLIIQHSPDNYGVYFYLTTSEADKDILKDFSRELDEYILKYNPFLLEKIQMMSYRGDIQFLKYAKVSWDKIILTDEILEEVNINFLYPLKHRGQCLKEKIPWTRGMLVTGRPGTGKTLLGKVLCTELKGCTILLLTAKAIDGSESIQLAFEVAKYLSPCLMIFEDIDLIGTTRERGMNPVLGELLTQLDGVENNDGIFILASSNRPDLLDQALINRPARFDAIVQFDLPDTKGRRRLFNLYLNKNEMDLDLDKVIGLTDGLTHAQVREVIIFARLLKLVNNKTKIDEEMISKSARRMVGIITKKGYVG